MKRKLVVTSIRLDQKDIERAKAFGVSLAGPIRQFIAAYLDAYAAVQKKKGVILCKRNRRDN